MNYPESLPLTEIKNILDIVKTGDIKGKVQDLMHNAWVLQGYLQKQMIGNPSNLLLAKQSSEDPVAVLENVINQADSSELVAQISVPWSIVLPWLLKLIAEAAEAAILA
jgi:hypothetical protein